MAGAVLLAAAPAAAHADAFTFGFAGGTMSGSGYFTYNTAAVPGVPGASQVYGLFGTFSDTALGISNATITGLVPIGLPSPVNADGTFVPPGSQAAGYGFSWDNLFYVGGNSPAVCPPPGPGDPEPPYPYGGGFLDIYGLMFTVKSGGNTYYVDIWSNGVLPGQTSPTYGVADSLNGVVLSSYGEPFSGQSVGVSGSPLAAPEPESLVLLGTGVLGAAGMIRRRLTAR